MVSGSRDDEKAEVRVGKRVINSFSDGSIHNAFNGNPRVLSATRDILSAARMRNFTCNKARHRKGSYLRVQNEDISNSACFFLKPY